uniref:Protein kinase domain-containing protein n=1 Tax=viral metagenome TaxID=1070528 RepID=A0A6C0KF92_9ZZZZ
MNDHPFLDDVGGDERCSTIFPEFTILRKENLEDPLLKIDESCVFRLVYSNQNREDNCTGKIKKGEELPVVSSEGKLYYGSCDEEENYILKIQNRYNRNEISFQLYASDSGIAPPIYEIWFCYPEIPKPSDCPTTSLFVMKRLSQTLGDILVSSIPINQKIYYIEKAVVLLERLHRIGIHHNDCHLENFMLDMETGELFLIDYGLSSRSDTKNDFNILYNFVLGSKINSLDKQKLLFSIKHTKPYGIPPLLDNKDKNEKSSTASRMGFTRIEKGGSRYEKSRSGGRIGQNRYDDDDDEEDDEEDN